MSYFYCALPQESILSITTGDKYINYRCLQHDQKEALLFTFYGTCFLGVIPQESILMYFYLVSNT